jgi:hypothetical protein
VPKPSGLKCSHGGLFDDSTFQPATGGINKDSGYYLFSPRADLHLVAANLAINHTEYFFNQIRTQVGDIEFNNFLSIFVSQDEVNAAQNVKFEACSSSGMKLIPIQSILIGIMLCIAILANFKD